MQTGMKINIRMLDIIIYLYKNKMKPMIKGQTAVDTAGRGLGLQAVGSLFESWCEYVLTIFHLWLFQMIHM